MTMSMDERLRFLAIELKFPSPRLLFLHDEFLEKERRFRHICGVPVFHKVGIFISECQDAARLASDNRIAAFYEWIQLSDIECRILASFFRETFGNHRPSATSSLLCNAHFVT